MALTKVPSNLDATIAITQSASDNSTNVATTAYVTTAIANIVDGAPSTLNTLDEIAAALNDDAALNTTLTNSIATKLPLAGGTLTGDLILKSDGGNDVINVVHSGNTVQLVTIGQSSDNSGNGVIQLKRNNGVLHSQIHSHGATYLNGGNVGIGFASGTPTDKVQILDSGNLALRVESTGASSQSSVWTENNAGSINGMFMYGSSHSTYGAIGAGEGAFYSNTNINIMSDSASGVIKFSTGSSGGSERMRIANSGYVGIGMVSPEAPLTLNDNWASASSGTVIHVKNNSSQYTAGDPYLTNSVPHGILITEDDSNTSGPTKQGLILYNDNNTAGAFSPILSFAKRETGGSPYRATMAAIYAKAPTGTGNNGAWIDGQLHFATAGAASEGTKSRMFIDKEGKVVVGPGNTTPDSLLHVEDSTHTAITIQAGTNSSASLRLKNDAQDWDVNTQTNDNFAVYNHTGGNQPFTISPAGVVTTSLNPAFRANAKAAQVYASGWQKVLYDQNVTQRGSAFASSRFTAPVDGWYQFNAQWTASNNSDNDGTLSLLINGSYQDLAGSSSMSNTGANYDGHVVSGCCYLAATHYVEVHRYSSVATTTRSSYPYGGWFSGFLIG